VDAFRPWIDCGLLEYADEMVLNVMTESARRGEEKSPRESLDGALYTSHGNWGMAGGRRHHAHEARRLNLMLEVANQFPHPLAAATKHDASGSTGNCLQPIWIA
jgi:hypothetical protein